MLVFGLSHYYSCSPQTKWWLLKCLPTSWPISRKIPHFMAIGHPRWYTGKESACQCIRCKGCEFKPWVGKTPWSRKWRPTPVFLSGKIHGQRSLMGYSPWGYKESDTIEHTCSSSTGNDKDQCQNLKGKACMVVVPVISPFYFLICLLKTPVNTDEFQILTQTSANSINISMLVMQSLLEQLHDIQLLI